jgi:Glycosyl transferase family 11.
MIITKIHGGLGNQLFQYAVGRQLAENQRSDLKLDLSHYKNPSKGTSPRTFKLDVFRIKANIVSPGDEDNVLGFPYLRPLKRRLKKMGLDVFRWNYLRETTFGFHPQILSFQKQAVLDGYWQSERYFPTIRSLLLDELVLKDKFVSNRFLSLKQEISAVESVAVHIRRGDYVHKKNVNQEFGVCSLEYYKKAIQLIKTSKQKPVFYIFSDDLAWCRENLPDADSLHFVSGFKDYQDLMLISSCCHQIVANSSFSWWGAWLNPNSHKIVIAPKTWFASPELDTTDIVPETWLRL